MDVGGHRLHLLCIGSGSPVVLFEGSGFGTSASFTDARTSIAAQTRICSYDRMGVGWSDPGSSEISAGLLAEDLRRLLDAVQMREPLIIVASSIGGVTAELFARRYPDRVAGLVFLDAANSDALTRVRERDVFILRQFACGTASAAGTIGLVRLIDPWDFRDEPAGRGDRSAALMYGAKPWKMLCAFVRAGVTTVRDFETAPPLRRDVPLTVLSAETRESLLPPALARLIGTSGGVIHDVRETHQRLAERSTRGTWRVVPGSDHLIASSQPQAVVDAVLEMVRLKPDTTAVSGSSRREAR